MQGNEISGEATVSFLYRNTDIYPEEVASNITIEDIPSQTVISLGLMGGYSFESYESGLEKAKKLALRKPNL
jgi:hypothetical protein